MKRFLIVCLAVLIFDAVATFLLWEWDGIYYILGESWAAVGIYKYTLERKLDKEP